MLLLSARCTPAAFPIVVPPQLLNTCNGPVYELGLSVNVAESVIDLFTTLFLRTLSITTLERTKQLNSKFIMVKMNHKLCPLDHMKSPDWIMTMRTVAFGGLSERNALQTSVISE